MHGKNEEMKKDDERHTNTINQAERHHRENIQYLKDNKSFQIKLALLTTFVVIGGIVISVINNDSTNDSIQELKTLMEKDFEVENFTPRFSGLGMDVQLSNSLSNPDKIYQNDILITTVSNHHLYFVIDNATLIENTWLGCYFEDAPIVRYEGSWTDTIRSNQPNGELSALIKIDYTPKEKFLTLPPSDDPLEKVQVGWIRYDIDVENIQTKEMYTTHPRSWMVVYLPEEYATHEFMCSD